MSAHDLVRRALPRLLVAPLTILILAGLSPALFHPGAASADEDEDAARPEPTFHLHGYGTAYYSHFDWQTDPSRRDRMDLERFALYPGVDLSGRFTVRGEIEFEHGGTGSTLELGSAGESGGYETEIEKGGEVQLEQLYLNYRFNDASAIAVGRLTVPVGLASTFDEPTEYRSPLRSEMESAIIPVNWYEDGLQFRWTPGSRFKASASVVNGLDSSRFSSDDWIVEGNQTRFETVNAENLAVAARLDWTPEEDRLAGVSVYHGDTTGNRPQPGLDVSAAVTVLDAHAAGELGPVSARGVVIYGHLNHADRVSAANLLLAGGAGAEEGPVGSAALGYSAEVALDLVPLLLPGNVGRALVYVRHDFYDTMYRVTGAVPDDPRWERRVNAVGANWFPVDDVVFKGEFSDRRLGIPTDNHERTLVLGFGFEF